MVLVNFDLLYIKKWYILYNSGNAFNIICDICASCDIILILYFGVIYYQPLSIVWSNGVVIIYENTQNRFGQQLNLMCFLEVVAYDKKTPQFLILQHSEKNSMKLCSKSVNS